VWVGMAAPITMWNGEPGSAPALQGAGFRVQGSGFRVQGSGFRVQGSGFRVQGSGFRAQEGMCKVDVRKVDVRLPGKGNSNSHGARPVHPIITMI